MTLRILYDAPKNGAELMDAIEEMTRGRWRPSPGSVYPLLDDLATEKLVKKRDDGRYELTATARREFAWPGAEAPPPRALDDMVREIEGYASYFEETATTKKSELEAVKPRLRAVAARLAKIGEERVS